MVAFMGSVPSKDPSKFPQDIYNISKDRDSGPCPPPIPQKTRKTPTSNLGGDRLADLYISQQPFTKLPFLTSILNDFQVPHNHKTHFIRSLRLSEYITVD